MNLKMSFVNGFIKRASEFNVIIKQADMEYLSNLFLPKTHDTIADAATKFNWEGNIGENLSIAGHIGAHGIIPGLAGAGIGAGIGHLSGNKKDKKKNALLGARVGGILGFGAGALDDAYQLGDNQRREFINLDNDDLVESSKHPSSDSKEIEQKIKKDINDLRKSKWYDHYSRDAAEARRLGNEKN